MEAFHAVNGRASSLYPRVDHAILMAAIAEQRPEKAGIARGHRVIGRAP